MVSYIFSDNAYQLLIGHGFSKTPVLEGTGAAAGEAYAWAIENADKVTCIVGRNPALRSLMSHTSPFENLGPLAKAGVPIVHLCDKTDPWFHDQTRVAEQRYKALGGEFTIIFNENAARAPLAPEARTNAVTFILQKQRLASE